MANNRVLSIQEYLRWLRAESPRLLNRYNNLFAIWMQNIGELEEHMDAEAEMLNEEDWDFWNARKEQLEVLIEIQREAILTLQEQRTRVIYNIRWYDHNVPY